ncbi:nucleoside deaminase [Spiroplasma alleghenense]|uniref:tRNA-specific adenosine deaminase n=1 Tax=Spiroplasma alleghenense TaxID=216931 RepID=A0A345Z253_9MOLU|nr:nucleoside deaminase [Spiroplasma alleghenense]AXK50682.1 tRNA-specific adenosine deaminase [Spiroplasma alleghenense]
MNNELFEILKKLTNQSLKSDDIPVAAIIVDKDNNIIGTGNNTRIKNNSLVEHAEINAVLSAIKKVNSFHLEDYKLITTLEPCLMCIGAIEQAYISEVQYIVESHKFGSITSRGVSRSKTKLKTTKINDKESDNYFKNQLQEFFKQLRKRGAKADVWN